MVSDGNGEDCCGPGHTSPSRAIRPPRQKLHKTGYEVIPLNLRPDVTEIRGLKVYHPLAESDRPVGMVQVFRGSSKSYRMAEQAKAIDAEVLWAQIGVQDEAAARLPEEAGLRVVMNRRPKMEFFRPFLKPRLTHTI